MRVESHWRVGFVTSRFNESVTSLLEKDAVDYFFELGGTKDQITRVMVPGALEIPMAARWLFEKGCQAIVALGVVIRGETTHYEIVCKGCFQGCLRLQEEVGSPLVFGVLTVENRNQALVRLGGGKGHKGKEAVEAMVEMLNLRSEILGK